MRASLAEEEISIVKESRTPEGTYIKFECGEVGDDQDYFEWWGLVRGLKKIEEQKRGL